MSENHSSVISKSHFAVSSMKQYEKLIISDRSVRRTSDIRMELIFSSEKPYRNIVGSSLGPSSITRKTCIAMSMNSIDISSMRVGIFRSTVSMGRPM